VASILKSQDPDGYIGIHDARKRCQPATVDRVTFPVGYVQSIKKKGAKVDDKTSE